jgi:hypothetical protein
MTETVADMGSLEKTIKKVASPTDVERSAIRELVVAARARGEDLTGPDGLLKLLTKTVLETALDEEGLGTARRSPRGTTTRRPPTPAPPRTLTSRRCPTTPRG